MDEARAVPSRVSPWLNATLYVSGIVVLVAAAFLSDGLFFLLLINSAVLFAVMAPPSLLAAPILRLYGAAHVPLGYWIPQDARSAPALIEQEMARGVVGSKLRAVHDAMHFRLTERWLTVRVFLQPPRQCLLAIPTESIQEAYRDSKTWGHDARTIALWFEIAGRTDVLHLIARDPEAWLHTLESLGVAVNHADLGESDYP